MSAPLDTDRAIEATKAEIEEALRDLALYLSGQDVLTYVERLAERMAEELAAG